MKRVLASGPAAVPLSTPVDGSSARPGGSAGSMAYDSSAALPGVGCSGSSASPAHPQRARAVLEHGLRAGASRAARERPERDRQREETSSARGPHARKPRVVSSSCASGRTSAVAASSSPKWLSTISRYTERKSTAYSGTLVEVGLGQVGTVIPAVTAPPGPASSQAEPWSVPPEPFS